MAETTKAKRTSTYLSPKTVDILDAAMGDVGSLSGEINKSIDRYHEVIRRHRGIEARFSEAELNALRDVCNGWLAEPAATIAGGLAMEFGDSLPDGIAEKWEIDAAALLAKLRALTYADELAMVAGIEAWWLKQP
jgi:hypothetical protein